MHFWQQQRVVVTGGTGFLGRRVSASLRARGCAALHAVGRSDYDRRQLEETARMYRELAPTLVIQLTTGFWPMHSGRCRR